MNQEAEKKVEYLTVREACKAIFWPPGFKDRSISSGFSADGALISVCASQPQGHLSRRLIHQEMFTKDKGVWISMVPLYM